MRAAQVPYRELAHAEVERLAGEKTTYGLDRDDADQLAALASALISAACSASSQFDGVGSVRQVIAELTTLQLYICWAGVNSVLAVLAQGADPAVIGHQMAQLVTAVRPFLDTTARHG